MKDFRVPHLMAFEKQGSVQKTVSSLYLLAHSSEGMDPDQALSVSQLVLPSQPDSACFLPNSIRCSSWMAGGKKQPSHFSGMNRCLGRGGFMLHLVFSWFREQGQSFPKWAPVCFISSCGGPNRPKYLFTFCFTQYYFN